MKLTSIGLFIFGASVTFFSMAASSQLTVDATGPIRQRLRPEGVMRAGSIGRKLPLQVSIEVHGTSRKDNGITEVDFILTNSGKDNLVIPISPHPGDLEPANPKITYTVKNLSLFVASHKHERFESSLAGGAHLYGNEALLGTLFTLAPGRSVRVLTRVAVPPISATDQDGTVAFVAHVMLDEETISMVDGQPFTDSHEIGSAQSLEYPPQIFLKTSQ
jgi:hypothetical protein